MSTQIRRFNNTIPPQTAIATPMVFQMQLGTFQVDRLTYRVPKGVNGTVGFYIASSGQQIIPYRIGSAPVWIIESDYSNSFDLTDQPDTGDFQMVGYNLGVWPHTIGVTFDLTPVDVTDPTAASAVLPTLTVLNS